MGDNRGRDPTAAAVSTVETNSRTFKKHKQPVGLIASLKESVSRRHKAKKSQ